MKVELRHLRYFVAVAETCHFGRAARRLDMAQPALSYAIRQLEEELGVSLFARTTRRVQLTAAGEFFLEEAMCALKRIESGIHGVRLLGSGKSGLVRIGLADTVTFSHMPFLVQTIKKRLPGLEFEVHPDMSTQAQCEGLREDALDIGVVHPPLDHENISMKVIGREPLVLVVPSGHPLAAKRSVAVTDLRDEPFITFADSESVVADAVLRLCGEAGFTPRRGHEASSIPMLLALIAAGLGIGVVPASARSVPLPGTTFCAIAGAPTVQVALAWSTEQRSPVVSNLLQVIDEDLPQRRPPAA